MIKKIFILISLLTIALVPAAHAKGKAAPKNIDEDYDPKGDTCHPNGKCTFYKKTTLPGGIPVEIQVVSLGGFRSPVDKVFDYAIGDVARVVSILDANNPNSEVAKVNANAGNAFVEVGPEFIQLLNAAKKVYLWTDGTFDITLTPDAGHFKDVKFTKNAVMLKKKGMRIGFDNMIHGYIADLLIRAIYNANIDNALVTVGPASRSIGQSVVGNWHTEVYDTEGRYARRGLTLDISNVSVASAILGSSAPTFDPRWSTPPFVPQCHRVTIISRNAAISEALAHGIFIWGPEKGMMLIEHLQTIRGVIVDNGGNFHKSPGL